MVGTLIVKVGGLIQVDRPIVVVDRSMMVQSPFVLVNRIKKSMRVNLSSVMKRCNPQLIGKPVVA